MKGFQPWPGKVSRPSNGVCRQGPLMLLAIELSCCTVCRSIISATVHRTVRSVTQKTESRRKTGERQDLDKERRLAQVNRLYPHPHTIYIQDVFRPSFGVFRPAKDARKSGKTRKHDKHDESRMKHSSASNNFVRCSTNIGLECMFVHSAFDVFEHIFRRLWLSPDVLLCYIQLP